MEKQVALSVYLSSIEDRKSQKEFKNSQEFLQIQETLRELFMKEKMSNAELKTFKLCVRTLKNQGLSEVIDGLSKSQYASRRLSEIK